ncbi:MAG: hypothetical protein RR066_04545 [Mucinivorans sp.]
MEELIRKIEYLEAENRRLREREADSASVLRVMIQKLPTPAVALDRELRLMWANSSFVELLDWQSRATLGAMVNMQGVELKNIVSAPVFNLIQGAHLSGEDATGQRLDLPDGHYNISVYNIRRGELTVALVSNLSNPTVCVTETVARLQQTIDRNMSMTQQIASLLGEQVSQNAKEMGDVIRMITVNPTT